MIRDSIIHALKTKYIGEMNWHIANIEVMLTNPVGVGDQASIVDTVNKEVLALESVHGRLNVLSKYIERRVVNAELTEETKKSKSK